MNREKLENYKQKAIDLEDYQLVGVCLDSVLSSLTLEFTDGSPERDSIFRFTNIAGFAFDKTADDDEGCFLIGEARLDTVENSRAHMLLLNLKESDGFHFYLDGDMRLEVIFGYLQIFIPE